MKYAINLLRAISGAVLMAGVACSTQVWAQAATVTGNFLGQKVNPVVAVELDAAPVRAMPNAPVAQPVESVRTEPLRTEPLAIRSGNAPMYTGLESSQSMGMAMPSLSTDRRQDGR